MDNSFTPADPATFQMVAGGALVLIGLVSLLAFLFRQRISPRGVMALHMLNLLTVLGSLFALFQPKGYLYGCVAVLLMIGLFRAMSKFENTDRS